MGSGGGGGPKHPDVPNSTGLTDYSWFTMKARYLDALNKHVLEPFRLEIAEIQARIREELDDITPSEDAALIRKALEHRLTLTQRALRKVEDDFAGMTLRRLDDEETQEPVGVRR